MLLQPPDLGTSAGGALNGVGPFYFGACTEPGAKTEIQPCCKGKDLFNGTESHSLSLVLWILYFCLVSPVIRSSSWDMCDMDLNELLRIRRT